MYWASAAPRLHAHRQLAQAMCTCLRVASVPCTMYLHSPINEKIRKAFPYSWISFWQFTVCTNNQWRSYASPLHTITAHRITSFRSIFYKFFTKRPQPLGQLCISCDGRRRRLVATSEVFAGHTLGIRMQSHITGSCSSLNNKLVLSGENLVIILAFIEKCLLGRH